MTDDLDESRKDYLIAAAKGAVGAIPFAGGVLSEVINLIPGQRADRIVEYVRKLEERIKALEIDKERILSSPENISLIEDGAYQAARATSSNRIDQISKLVVEGISDDETAAIRRRRLLKLFDSIDDDELRILNAYGQSYGGDASDAWQNIERPRPTHLGSSREEFDEASLFQLGTDNLKSLGLLKQNFGHLRKGQLPEFDPRAGGFKHRTEVSQLGRLLLREIGQPTPIDARDS